MSHLLGQTPLSLLQIQIEDKVLIVTNAEGKTFLDPSTVEPIEVKQE